MRGKTPATMTHPEIEELREQEHKIKKQNLRGLTELEDDKD